jgi:Cysteine-rich CWC
MISLISKSKCPLCGKFNQCAMEITRETGVNPGPCWCAGLDFSADLLAKLPPEAQGQSCICEACASKPAQALDAQGNFRLK